MPTRPPVHRPYPHDPEKARKAQLAALDARRGSSASRGYDGAWQRLRKQVLSEEPHCRFCRDKGLIMPARDVDHIIPVALRPDLRLVRSNLRPLCQSHHSSLTASGKQRRQP